MNKYQRNEKRDVFIGRNANGDRFFVDFAYSETYPVLLSGSCIEYRHRYAHNVGQMLHRLPEVVTFAYGLDAEKLDEIRKVWDQYQLVPADKVPADVAAKVVEWTNSLL